MFCSSCGEKLNVANQRYCPNCGTENIGTSNSPNLKTQKIPNVPIPPVYYAPLKQQAQRQIGRAGKYSKLCLGLALVSLAIGIITLILGYNFYRSYSWMFSGTIGRAGLLIVILILRVVGLTMGILARVNSSKAEIVEPYNDAEKAGSLLSILAIIVNAIGLFMSLIGPMSILNLPYF